jgi:hypothetical protein
MACGAAFAEAAEPAAAEARLESRFHGVSKSDVIEGAFYIGCKSC